MKKSLVHRCFFTTLILALFLLSTSIFSAESVMASSDVIKWRCQVNWPPASQSYAKSGQAVCKEIERRTNGRLVVELYTPGALVPEKELFPAVKRGMIQIGVTASGYYRDQVPLANISGLPMNFRDIWECTYFYQELGFEQMMRESLAKHGIYYSTDRVNPTQLALKKPIRKMEDFKGLKVRSYGVLHEFFNSLGAASSYIPGVEIYTSLASGIVDGAHWAAATGNDNLGFYDICKYHLDLNLNIGGHEGWLVNQEAMNKLPKDLQEILISVLADHFWKRTNQFTIQDKFTLNNISKDKGVTILNFSPEEYTKMQQTAVKLWDVEAKKSPDSAKAVEILKSFMKDLGHL